MKKRNALSNKQQLVKKQLDLRQKDVDLEQVAINSTKQPQLINSNKKNKNEWSLNKLTKHYKANRAEWLKDSEEVAEKFKYIMKIFPFSLEIKYPLKNIQEISPINVWKKTGIEQNPFMLVYEKETFFNVKFTKQYLCPIQEILQLFSDSEYSQTPLQKVYWSIACINSFFYNIKAIIAISHDGLPVNYSDIHKIISALPNDKSLVQYYIYQFLFDLESFLKDIINRPENLPPIDLAYITKIRAKKILFDVKRKVFNIMLTLNIFPHFLAKVFENSLKDDTTINNIINNPSMTDNAKVMVIKKLFLKTKNISANTAEFVAVLCCLQTRYFNEFSEYLLDLTKNTILPVEHAFIQHLVNDKYKDPSNIKEYFYKKEQDKKYFLIRKVKREKNKN